MSGNLPFNFLFDKPQLADVLELLKKEILLSLNCHALATVQSFDSTDAPTVTATMNYTKSQYTRDDNGLYTQKNPSYPILFECPAIILGGGGFNVTFPIAKGDQCLILFNDRDIDNWVQGALSGPVASPRLHSFSDAIALVGLQQTPLSNYDASRAMLRNKAGDTYVSVGTKISIKNAAQNLKTILDTLLTAIGNATSSTGDTGIATIASAASSAKSSINALLE